MIEAYPSDALRSRVAGFKRACHIKLGRGGELADECIRNGKLYIGYFTGEATLPLLVRPDERKWEDLRRQLQGDPTYANDAARTAALNQVKAVVDDDGGSLWFTFHGSRMYWTFVDTAFPLLPWPGHGTYRRTTGWRCADLKGTQIDEGMITTRISQVRTYQRTVRGYDDRPDDGGVNFNPVQYLRNRVLGEPQPSEIEARDAQETLERIAEQLIVRLSDKEFENFVDLIFVGDGWQRVTEVGGLMADIDGQYQHATSGAVAKVQVKSSISMSRLEENPIMGGEGGSGDWIFWVYHTADPGFERDVVSRYGSQVHGHEQSWHPYPGPHSPGRLYLLNRGRLAKLAVRKGLVGWLRQKAC